MYEQFYGLSGKPFQLSPDPAFFFGSRGHRRAMAYLEYGLHQAEGFIVMTGEVGAGKTTLVRQLLQRLAGKPVVPVQIVTTQLHADDLLRLVAASFGLPVAGADKAALLVRLEAFLRELHEQGRRALLIVDEAQNLGGRAIEELRMLSNFQVGTRAILQSFLVGQPELRDLMQRPEMSQLKQRIIAAYHLGPLDRQETQQYVEHRLSHVGWKNDPSFEPEAFDRLYEASGGVPRRINTIADRLLLSGFLAEKHRIGAQDVIDVVEEIRVELGPRSAFLNGGAPEGTEPEAGLRELDVPRPATGERDDRVAILEERIVLLEESSAAVHEMLSRMLRRFHPEQKTAEPRE